MTPHEHFGLPSQVNLVKVRHYYQSTHECSFRQDHVQSMQECC